MANQHLESWLTWCVLWELCTETTTRYHHPPLRMANVQKADNSECCRGCGATGTLLVIDCGSTQWYGHFGRCLLASCKTKYRFAIQSSSHIPWYLPNVVENLGPRKNLPRNAALFNLQKQTTKMSCNRCKEGTVVHPNNEVLFKGQKKGAIKPQKVVEEP